MQNGHRGNGVGMMPRRVLWGGGHSEQAVKQEGQEGIGEVWRLGMSGDAQLPKGAQCQVVWSRPLLQDAPSNTPSPQASNDGDASGSNRVTFPELPRRPVNSPTSPPGAPGVGLSPDSRLLAPALLPPPHSWLAATHDGPCNPLPTRQRIPMIAFVAVAPAVLSKYRTATSGPADATHPALCCVPLLVSLHSWSGLRTPSISFLARVPFCTLSPCPSGRLPCPAD